MRDNCGIHHNTTFYICVTSNNTTTRVSDNAQVYSNALTGSIFSNYDNATPFDTIVITGGRIHHNTSGAQFGPKTNCIVTITGGSFDHNGGTNDVGFKLVNNAAIKISGGSFSNNTSEAEGTAVTTRANATESLIEITGGKFIGNKSADGAVVCVMTKGSGLFNRVSISGASAAASPLFADNIATGDGGAVWLPDHDSLTLGPNVRFKDNRASRYRYGSANPADISIGARAVVDPQDLTFTSPFVFAFNNADVNADFTNPSDQTAPFVRFDPQGGDIEPPEQIIDPTGNLLASRPENPRKYDKVFTGWYTEPAGGIKWDFSTMPVTAGMTARASQYGLYLYAHWRGLNSLEQCQKRWTKGKRTP
jgi:hypothetical protein